MFIDKIEHRICYDLRTEWSNIWSILLTSLIWKLWKWPPRLINYWLHRWSSSRRVINRDTLFLFVGPSVAITYLRVINILSNVYIQVDSILCLYVKQSLSSLLLNLGYEIFDDWKKYPICLLNFLRIRLNATCKWFIYRQILSNLF